MRSMFRNPSSTSSELSSLNPSSNSRTKSYPSLLSKSTQLSDSPFSSKSLCKSPTTQPTNNNVKNNLPSSKDPENQNVKSIENAKSALQNKNSSILSPHCTNKLPTIEGPKQFSKFIAPSKIAMEKEPIAIQKSKKDINHFKPPQINQPKRKYDEFQNSESFKSSSSNTKPTTVMESKKQKKKKSENCIFQRNFFENIQKELSNQPFISSANPLTPSPESNGTNTAVFNGTKEENLLSSRQISTNFMILSDSQDSITLTEDEEDLEIFDNTTVEEAVRILFRSKLGSTLATHTKEKYLRNIINPVEVSRLGINNLFGKNYPSIGSISFKDKKPIFKLLSDGSLNNISEATGKSIYHSYSRLARIIMSLDLGKSMIFVNFSEDDWDEDFKRDLIQDVCLDGFSHSSIEYKFFGTSNSGINGYTALFLDKRLNFSGIHDLLGDFSECGKSGPRKVFSRIALSLGKSYQSTVELKEDEMWILHDEKDFPGVDGAGFMHEDYFRQILKGTIVSPFFEQTSSPTGNLTEKFMDCDINEIVAIQFRVLGMKGVFQVIPDEYWKELQGLFGFPDSVKCVVRPSLIKYSGNKEIYRNFDVLNVSRIQGGSINRTFMSCMLRRTSNKEAMQQLFFNMLDDYTKAESNIQDPKFLYNSLLSSDVFDSGGSVYKVVKNLLLSGFGMENPFVYKYIKKRIKARFQSLIDNRLCLKMKSKFSVTLMGVIDESGELEENEVFVPCLKIQGQLARDYYKLKEVIVYRHPLAYEGDITKLKLRKDPCNSFLASRSNVIVFPKVFQKKSPQQFLAGGDLDGDAYEIVFDLEILKLFDMPSTPIDYDEGKQSSDQASQPVTKLTSHNIITEHVKCFIQKHTKTGLLFYLNTVARDSDNINLKIRLAKAYSDSIDSMKGSEQNFEDIITEAKVLPKQSWYQLSKTVKVSKWTPKENAEAFEYKMLNKVVQAYQQIGLKKSTELEPELIIEWDKESSYCSSWKTDFENAYKKWNDYWKRNKKTFESTQLDFTFNDRFFNEKLNMIMANMISYQNKNNIDEPKWQELFIGDTFGKHLVKKASVWLQLAYEKEKELTKEYGQGDKKYKKSILKSPFLYTCALPYITQLKIRDYKTTSLIHPEIRVKIT